MRTLGVSLVAVAAIVASVTLARHRGDPRPPLPAPATGNLPAPLDLNLDAIRAAGL